MKNVLVLAAMLEEEQALLGELGSSHWSHSIVSPSLGIELRTHISPHRTVHICRSGMGPVNAALSLAMVADRHPIDAVLLLGVGGAVSPELAIGDLVVSKQVLQHDSFFSLDFGYPRVLPGHLIFTSAEAQAHVALVDADPQLVEWVSRCGTSGKVRVGTVLSGNEFVGTVERKRALAALHDQALLVDMEAAGVAQVASRLKLPFVVAKTVADRLNPDGSIENDFRTCLEAASVHAAKCFRAMLAQ